MGAVHENGFVSKWFAQTYHIIHFSFVPMYCMYHVMSSIMYSHRIIVWYMYPWLPMQSYLWLPISTRLNMAKYIIYIDPMRLWISWTLEWCCCCCCCCGHLCGSQWASCVFWVGCPDKTHNRQRNNVMAVQHPNAPVHGTGWFTYIYMKGEKWPHFQKGKWGESQILTARHICRIMQIETTSCFGRTEQFHLYSPWTRDFCFFLSMCSQFLSIRLKHPVRQRHHRWNK